MVGSAPYQKACNGCGKMIVLGIDKDTNKWRPFDNYATGEKHNCSARAITTEKISTIGTGQQQQQQGQASTEDLAEIKKELGMNTWMLEKLCKKLDVHLDESNE